MSQKKEKLRSKRFMRNKKSFILLTVLSMGIGFAFLTSNLTITGNTSVSGNSWSVYFNNVQVTDGSVEATVVPTTTGTTTTSIDYTVTLDKPGDFYEFTVDAVNAGTIDAMIQSINMTSLDVDVAKYLTYTATYLDGTPLAQNDVLEADESTTYKVRVEYKKNISASDLDEEGVNLTLSFGVNYVQSTFKPQKFTDLVRNTALLDNNVHFNQYFYKNNETGLYVMNSTANDTNPIYYYRGAVTNNNAIFAGFCWKIVRTTDTGGTKLIYNGLPTDTHSSFEQLNQNKYVNVTNDANNPFTFNGTTKRWENSSSGSETTIVFSMEEAGNYNLNYKLDSSSGWVSDAYVLISKNGVKIGEFNPWEEMNPEPEGNIFIENISSSDVITILYGNWSNEVSFSFDLKKGLGQKILGCTTETGDTTQLADTTFNNIGDYRDSSPAYSGYMYGNVYHTNYDKEINVNTYLYGSSFEFTDVDSNVSGDGTYTLTNTTTDIDQINTHHYTCFSTEGTCSGEIYYAYFKSSDIYNARGSTSYISLKDGKTLEEAMAEMQVNTNDSNIKTTVDTWFNNTFRTYFTTHNKDYNNYLEDTVWCNDRSVNTIDVDGTGQYTNNGWNPNGGNVSNSLRYSSYGRMKAGAPSLSCPNKNDSFTVTESATGNGSLAYPVGMLTVDEMIMAGSGEFDSSISSAEQASKKTLYLYNGRYWWLLSPGGSGSLFFVDNEGSFGTVSASYDDNGIRPMISVKSDVKIKAGGDGTKNNPYVFAIK